jgi:hypothetical protein
LPAPSQSRSRPHRRLDRHCWRHDSKALDALADASKDVNNSSRHARPGRRLKKDRPADQRQSTVRESRINTIYRDVAVHADCAVPDVAGSLLDDAIGAANTRR